MGPSPDQPSAVPPDPSPEVPSSSRPGPRRALRRGLAAVGLVAVGALVGATTAIASDQFSDVPDTNPFHDDIGWAAENGVVGGYQDGTFKPGNPITRQAITPILRRLAGADPSVDPMVTADGIEIFRASGDNATITATSLLSGQVVLTMDVESPGLYLLVFNAEYSTTQTTATVACWPSNTSTFTAPVMTHELRSDGLDRAPVAAVSMVEEGGTQFTIKCYKAGAIGPGSTTVVTPNAYAIKVADQPPTRAG